MVSRDIIPNNIRSYKNLGNLINDARLAGLFDWHAIEEDNERYYTPDGYHIYYDRKILRRLYSQNSTAAETNDE